MGNTLRTASATGLATVFFATSGCGNDTAPSREVPVQGSSEAPAQTIPEQPAPAEKTPKNHKVIGIGALSGCDLNRAKEQLRQRVIDGRRFRGYKVTDGDGNEVFSYISNNRTTLVNPIALKCRKKVVAFAGVAKPLKTTKQNNYDPVRVIRFTINAPLLYTVNNPNGNSYPATEMVFDRSEFVPHGVNTAGWFSDSPGSMLGAAGDDGDLPDIPNIPQPDSQEDSVLS